MIFEIRLWSSAGVHRKRRQKLAALLDVGMHLARSRPLVEGGAHVPHGAPELVERRAVAAHAACGQPAGADPEVRRCLFRREVLAHFAHFTRTGSGSTVALTSRNP